MTEQTDQQQGTDKADDQADDQQQSTDSSATDDKDKGAEQSDDKKDSDEAPLGDAGKKALAAERKAAQEARKEAAEAKKLAAELQAKIDGKEAEHAAEQKQREVEQAALDKANDRIKKAEIRAAAAGKLEDPKDALLHLNLSDFEVDSDGAVDGDAIASAIEDLIKQKPYLSARSTQRFQGSGDGGARDDSKNKPAQLTEADVKRLRAEGKHEEIVKAQAEGRLADYLAS